MLAGCTDLNVYRYFVFKFLEFVVSIDKVYLETASSENCKDLFDTIDDVLGSSFVRGTESFLLAFADAVESLSCVKFNLGGLHKKIWGSLYV